MSCIWTVSASSSDCQDLCGFRLAMRGPVRKRTIEHAKGVRRPGSGGRVSGHALLDAWHADQNEVDVIAVEEIAQVLQGNGIEAFRFVEDDQLHVFPRQGARRLAGVLIDANIDAAESLIDLVPQRPEIGANIGRRKEDARPRERRIYLLVCFIARSPASENDPQRANERTVWRTSSSPPLRHRSRIRCSVLCASHWQTLRTGGALW